MHLLIFWLLGAYRLTLYDIRPLARIGPNLLVTNDAELLRCMSGARSLCSRADWYDGLKLDPRLNNVISQRNEKRHTALRAKMPLGVSLSSSIIDALLD